MLELKDCFVREEFSNVETYAQSGKVIFDSSWSTLENLGGRSDPDVWAAAQPAEIP
jgi:hypothetical protein